MQIPRIPVHADGSERGFQPAACVRAELWVTHEWFELRLFDDAVLYISHFPFVCTVVDVKASHFFQDLIGLKLLNKLIDDRLRVCFLVVIDSNHDITGLDAFACQVSVLAP